MSPYRPQGSTRWWCTMTTRDGRYVRLRTGTRDRAIADQMQAMLVALQGTGKRAWDLIAYLDANRRELPRVFDHWTTGTLDRLREELADIDLAPRAAAWEAARAAAWAAASAAASAAAWAALRPTVEALQASAVELLGAMCDVGRVAQSTP